MRLGLIGDVHAEDVRLRVALDALAAMRVDRVLCTGDLVDGHGDLDRACALLRERGVLTVRGNHDRWLKDDTMRDLPRAHRMTSLAPETIAHVKSLSPTHALATPIGRLLLCHGIGDNDMCRLLPDDEGYAISSNTDLLKLLFDPGVAIMVGGHTHRPMVRRFERGSGKPPLFVVNAGTLAREDGPGFVLVDLAQRRVEMHRLGEDLAVKLGSVAVL
jgi:predicted phosphodiesterase